MTRVFVASDTADKFAVASPGTFITFPFTVHIHFRATSNESVLFSQFVDDNDFFEITWLGGDAGIFSFLQNSGGNEFLQTGNTPSAGSWEDVLFLADTNHRRIILSGNQGGAGDATGSFTEPDWSGATKNIGNKPAIVQDWADSDISLVTVWNVELATVYQDALSDGIHPWLILPENRIHSWLLDRASGDNEPDYGSLREAMVQSSSPAFISEGPPIGHWLETPPYLEPDAAVGPILVSPIHQFQHILVR